MGRFPREFEDFLTAAGRRVIAGRSPWSGALADPRRRFLAADGLIDRRQAAAAVELLNRTMFDLLEPLDRPIPPESIWDMTADYSELLPKTVRARTAYLENRRERSFRRAESIGVVAMLGSESFRAFAAALAGRDLRARRGMQLLCYGPGDYAGPHNDHHPEQPAARDGYLDVHVSLCGRGVAQHWLVYGIKGHFTEIADVARAGGVTAYRLPFWHYTTPLVAKPKADPAAARRWVLLGTFLYKKSG
jgi:hypothetical protein